MIAELFFEFHISSLLYWLFTEVWQTFHEKNIEAQSRRQPENAKVYELYSSYWALSLYSSCISQKPRVIEKFGLVDLTMFLAKFAPTEIKRRQNDNRQRRAACRASTHTRRRLSIFFSFWGPTDDLDIINNGFALELRLG